MEALQRHHWSGNIRKLQGDRVREQRIARVMGLPTMVAGSGKESGAAHGQRTIRRSRARRAMIPALKARSASGKRYWLSTPHRRTCPPENRPHPAIRSGPPGEAELAADSPRSHGSRRRSACVLAQEKQKRGLIEGKNHSARSDCRRPSRVTKDGRPLYCRTLAVSTWRAGESNGDPGDTTRKNAG